MTTRDTRGTPRIQPYVLPCHLIQSDGAVVEAYLTDLSVRGAQVVCDIVAPEEGSHVVLEVHFRRLPAPLHLPAQVRWCREAEGKRSGHTLGLEFVDPPEAAQLAIESVIAEFQRWAERL